MNIAFFISDHGFGHIMRNLPVIRELIERGHNIILVSGDKHLKIAEQYICEEAEEKKLGQLIRISYHTDVGLIVRPGTLLMDKEKTSKAVDTYITEFPEKIEFARRIFSSYSIHKVVADIVPWALKAAAIVGLPSYIMASFTWIEQYEGVVEEDNLSILRDSFKSAEHILYYDLVNMPTRKLFGKGMEIGFVARQFHDNEVRKIKGNHQRKVVFLSLGGSNSGLDFDIDVSYLPYDFITTSALRLIGDNVEYLDVAISNTQDYVKAADYCIAKAGWSTVSEMMLSGNPFAVITRPDVPEDTMIIEQLERRQAALAISVEELRDLESVLYKLENREWSHVSYENSYKIVVDIILS